MFNIALYQPDIPQNTAAIVRLCSCFNATLEIIEPCGFHLNDKRFKRVAMDYLDKEKIISYKSYEDFIKNPLQTIEDIYANFTFSFDKKNKELLESYIEKNVKTHKEKHIYTLEEYGLDKKEVHNRLK